MLLPVPAHAAGERAVLKDTAVSRFNADDVQLMQARVREALLAEGDGEVLNWRNEQSKASGSVTPLNRLRWKELDCRRLRIVNQHGNNVQAGDYKFCQKPPGTWKLVGPDPSPG